MKKKIIIGIFLVSISILFLNRFQKEKLQLKNTFESDFTFSYVVDGVKKMRYPKMIQDILLIYIRYVSSYFADVSNFVDSYSPWFIRGGNFNGGSEAGVGTFDYMYGHAVNDVSFRIVLIP